MSTVIAVGPMGPAPPQAASPSAGSAGTEEAAPFAEVLQGVRPSGRPNERTDGEPPEAEPGSLDLASLIQLLLGGDAPVSDQTATTTETQPVRSAEAGTDQNNAAGSPVDGAMLVALMPPPVLPVVDVAVGQSVVVPPVTSIATAQAVTGAAASATSGIEVASPRPEPVATAPVLAGPLATPPVIAATDTTVAAAAVEVATVMAAPVAGAVAAVEESTTGPIVAESEALGTTTAPVKAVTESAAVDPEPEVVTADATATEQTAELLVPEVIRKAATAPPTAASPEADVTAEASVIPMAQPTTASVRSQSQVTAVDTPAPVAANEAFTSNLANTVQRASMLGDHEVRLLLNPPDLGHLDVRIVESPQGLRVVLEASNAEARDLIQQQLPSLRSALEARDLRVDRLQVSQSSDASAQGQSDRGLPQGGQGNDGPGQFNQNSTPWSPVASFRSDASADAAAVGGATAASGSMSSGPATSDGRVDVLA